MHELIHVFETITGSGNESGTAYGFWSGFGGSIPDFLILATLAGYYHKHNCLQKGCWRLSRHTTAAGHPVCRRHHPELAGQRTLTAAQIAEAHEAAK